VILTSDPDIRRTAGRILLWQAMAVTALAVICYALFSRQSGLSALTGGAIGVVANAYMTVTALRPTRSPGGALGRLLFGQLLKVAFTVAGFVIVAKTGRAHWPSLLVAYVATLVVFWIVPAVGRREPQVSSREG
jgi:F0F1-type ATP synthase assembly protein I